MSTEVIEAPAAEPVAEVVAPVTEGSILTPEPVVPEVVAPPAPVVPEKYELSLPENAALDATAIERTAAFARERGLTNEAASAALHLANTEVAAALEARTLAETTLVASWKAESLADPALGKTPEARTAAIQKGVQVLTRYTTAHPERADAFKGFLNETGLGNHPEAVRFFAYLGEAASEGSLVTSQIGGDSRRSDQDVFYGRTS